VVISFFFLPQLIQPVSSRWNGQLQHFIFSPHRNMFHSLSNYILYYFPVDTFYKSFFIPPTTLASTIITRLQMVIPPILQPLQCITMQTSKHSFFHSSSSFLFASCSFQVINSSLILHTSHIFGMSNNTNTYNDYTSFFHLPQIFIHAFVNTTAPAAISMSLHEPKTCFVPNLHSNTTQPCPSDQTSS
jgi:hypothetical protein